ncbi:universal stress protein [Cohaesibacter celericrescens]|uniref:Uncharacterized protein n=1 Tax=Cohaesibacter celericrescens TaxID=2067669 RepID=A0A2N5XVB2_9HYPH|nr:universal stress protein [Cohaesibacter celericrescens]PLW78466.1 hypothetical protein C0081_04265 [Cohaesibacter celericrescens]
MLVAWNSRREVAPAIYNAREFLKHVVNVSIVIIDPIASSNENGEELAADLTGYLVPWCQVTLERLASGGKNATDVTKQHAMDVVANMVAMGALGHSGLRERIFSGVSQAFIDDTPVPVFGA